MGVVSGANGRSSAQAPQVDGVGEDVFNAIGAFFLAWSFVLLVYGIRTTYGWTWLRSLGTVVLSVLALLCVVVIFLVGSA